MYFYLAMVGFEPTPTTTAAPSNTETTVIPSRPLRSLKRSYHDRGLCLISLHYTSDRVIRFRCANTIIYIYMVGLNHQQCKSIFTERFRLLPSSEFTGKSRKYKIIMKMFLNLLFKFTLNDQRN